MLVTVLSWPNANAQKRAIKEYLTKNQQEINLAVTNEIQLENDFLGHQLYFFGFIHGSTSAQEVDFALFKKLNQQAGLKYYAPEVGPSFALFLNKYLTTGDEELLKTLVRFYAKRVPQDAGIEWMKKWQKFYEFNRQKKPNEKIHIIGTDAPISPNLTLAHIATLLQEEKTGNPTLDSLQYFKTLSYPDGVAVWSGKPAQESGKPWNYFFPNPGREYLEMLFTHLKEGNQEELSKAFGTNWQEVKWLIELSSKKGRENIIFENFKKLVLPLIDQGEKVYANFGYFHIQQGLINGNESLAYKLKHKLDKNISMVSIQGLLAKSAVFKEKRYKKEGEVIIKDVVFQGMVYNGYKHSRTWDGDSFLERAKGIGILKTTINADATFINLNKDQSPFRNTNYFASFSRGGKKWKLEEGKSTTDYFQYVIFIQNSPSISPLEELE